VVTQPGARHRDGPVASIGAGIGGLTAALSLQHVGVPVRVFEQARALREIGAGVTITPNAMNVLDFLGIGPALAEQAGETPRYFVRSAADGQELERGPDPDSFVPEFGAGYCNLHRADLHVALTDAVTKNDPDAVALDHRFDYLEQDGDRVIPHFSNGTTFDAAHPMTPYLGQGACMAIEDGMILGRAFAVSQDLAEAFSRYEAARRDRANGVQLAARYPASRPAIVVLLGFCRSRSTQDRPRTGERS
jgi:2-polyprenyl-6-methoxyphenol hydroxylase-like FAD-dependent oxidoreductase